jgi:hypothetical protein
MESFKVTEINKKLKALNAIDLSKNDKLTYAVKKTTEAITEAVEALNKKLKVGEIQKEYSSELEKLNIKYTSVGEDGNIFTENDRFVYKFTKENLTLRNTELKAVEDTINKKLEDYQEVYINSTIEINVFKAQLEGEGWDRVKGLDLFVVEDLKDFLF